MSAGSAYGEAEFIALSDTGLSWRGGAKAETATANVYSSSQPPGPGFSEGAKPDNKGDRDTMGEVPGKLSDHICYTL